VSDLIKRLRYREEHGLFKAVEDGMNATSGQAATRIEALEEALRAVVDASLPDWFMAQATAREALGRE